MGERPVEITPLAMKRMTTATYVVAILAGVLASACGLPPASEPTIHVSAEILPWGDLSSFHTYRWWQPAIAGDVRYANERAARLDWYVREAVGHELSTRGYVPDTAGKPDFVVRYDIGTYDDSTSSVSDYMEYRAEGGHKDMGQAFMGYQRGMLIVELVDATTTRVAWRGKAMALFEANARGKRIAPAVAKMMGELPAAR